VSINPGSMGAPETNTLNIGAAECGPTVVPFLARCLSNRPCFNRISPLNIKHPYEAAPNAWPWRAFEYGAISEVNRPKPNERSSNNGGTMFVWRLSTRVIDERYLHGQASVARSRYLYFPSNYRPSPVHT